MYLEKSLGIFMGAFVVWGFLMALFFNLMLKVYRAKNDTKLIWCSFVMALSYGVSDHFFDFFSGVEVYLTWFYYDMVTLLLISPILFVPSRCSLSPGVIYVLVGLSFNSLLMLSMHYDIVIRENYTSWWLWSVYSIGINLADLIMIVALIVDRDFLCIIRIKNICKEQLTKKSDWFLFKCFSLQ
ncbi:hypothetical protein CWC05_00845 [Pseudoalteromonas ruthenica]|uniref:Uncharacterized protein n=1 Tax=Pseudoalteromonas ruthenica TaxID=151081 RepID=A0A5S3Z9L3_9GAMM|nr:hypothetical protein [Pseudoalteromonas ruthenica]TMP88932.1 hypothetical protein CWC05_00845 [Pseudoalteromonas ruthenica]